MNEPVQINPRIANYIESVERQLEEERNKRMMIQNEYTQTSGYNTSKETNLVAYQLELQQELDRIYHLLSGHVLQIKDNNETWEEPRDDRLKIFSEYGVKQIMNIISFYVNRNTLLSNYDEKTIMWKVRDFGIELAELIYMRYEVFFSYPSPEELYEKYLSRINNFGYDITEDELYNKCVQWSKEELQSKIRHYPMICMSLIDTVHSTYLRAFRGQERESLRKFMHVSQSANQQPEYMQQPKSFSLIKPSTWKNP
jgi:hypothetical protein